MSKNFSLFKRDGKYDELPLALASGLKIKQQIGFSQKSQDCSRKGQTSIFKTSNYCAPPRL